jgi:hypothetical protein
MAALLEHPLARARYRQRKASVQPRFAELRERQGLKRFHRRGLPQCTLNSHCTAWPSNLKRAVGLFGRIMLTRSSNPWPRQAPFSRRLIYAARLKHALLRPLSRVSATGGKISRGWVKSYFDDRSGEVGQNSTDV